MEYRLRRHDGEYRWVLDIEVPRFNPDGSFVGYIGIDVAVTDGKQAEAELRESEERLSLAAQVGKMYAYEWDVATDVIIQSEEHASVPSFSDQGGSDSLAENFWPESMQTTEHCLSVRLTDIPNPCAVTLPSPNP